jgi:hypothetical protein
MQTENNYIFTFVSLLEINRDNIDKLALFSFLNVQIFKALMIITVSFQDCSLSWLITLKKSIV